MRRLLFACLLILGLCLPAWADSHTWANGGVDVHWATVGNWSGGAAPATGDTAVFDNAALTLPDTFLAAGNTISVTLSGAFTLDASGLAPFIGTAATLGTCTFGNAGTVTLPTALTVSGALTFNAAGTLACNAAGTTLTTTGAAVGSAIGTLTNPLHLVLAGASKGWSWGMGSGKVPASVTVTGSYTTTSTVFTAAFGGTGTLNLGASWMAVMPAAADFWSGTVALSNGTVYPMYWTQTSRTNAALMGFGSANVILDPTTLDVTLTANGGFQTTGTLALRNHTNAKKAALAVNGACSVGNVTLGTAAASDIGVLTLASGYNHVLGSLAIAGGNTATAHAVTYGGRVTVNGNQTLAGVVPTFGTACLVAGAAVTVNGAGAGTLSNLGCDFLADSGTKVFTLSNIGAVTPPLRIWCQGGTDTGSLEFHPVSPDALCGDGT